MELRECKFYYTGEAMSFTVYSDHPCRARYRDSIRMLPISPTQVQVYELEPGAESRWVVVRQTEGKSKRLQLFLRSGERFLQQEAAGLPPAVKEEILKRFPGLTGEFQTRPALRVSSARKA
jgi:hypothetical protein